jgi:flagellar hook-associated protein 2
MSVATISGAVSGLDTATLINSLVSVQANQQTLLSQQQAKVQKTADAFSSLVTALGTLSTQATDLAHTTAWKGTTASSSSTGVSVTATGSKAGSLTFNVKAVAAAHTLVSSEAVTGLTTTVAAGALTLTRADGTTASISIGSGSLTDVVAGINGADVGLVAAPVQTAANTYRLQVASTSTGAGSSFTLTGLTGFTGTDVLTQGADATLHLGATTSGYDVTSTTNTFDSLVPGMSFTVTKPEDNVTVSAKVDGSTIADKVNTLVNTANSILNSITTNTAYNATTKAAGPLTGESSVRSLQQNILSAVGLADAPGVDLTRDGHLSFTRDTFLTAFTADPAKVAAAFGVNASFTKDETTSAATTATLSNALKSARAGSYPIQVDTAPAREQWKLDPAGATIAGHVVTLTRDTTTLSYTATGTDTLATAAASLNALAAAKGFGVTATASATGLVFTAASTGTSSAFTAALDGAAGTQVAAGANVSGQIDGQDAVGVGSVLSLPTGTGGAVGLSVEISTTAGDLVSSGGAIGTLNYTPGLAQRLVTLVNDATNTSTGTLAAAKDGTNAEIKRYQKSIDAWNTRLAAYRTTLTAQFTAMETALASLKKQTAAISSLLSNSSSSSSSGSSSSGTLSSGG